MSSVLSLENPLFRDFAFYGTLCLGKLVLNGPLTTFARAQANSAAAPEDGMFYQQGFKADIIRGTADPRVERVRRMHRNDMENIPPFLFAGLLYVMTEPDPEHALWHFRIFTCARMLHSLCYMKPSMGQPGRFISYVVGLGSTACLIYKVLRAVW